MKPSNQSPSGSTRFCLPRRDDPDTDVALIARIAAQDQSAVGELYDRHCRLVYGLALHILTERAEAEAVVEHVFLSVWQHVGPSHLAILRPVSWLVRLTRNLAVERLRALGLHGVDRAPVSVESSDIGRALGRLSDEQRTLIEVAYFGGLTRSELAARFGLSLTAVTASLRAGMHTLNDLLRQSAALRDVSSAHPVADEQRVFTNPLTEKVSPVRKDRRSTPANLIRELAPPYAERLGIASEFDRRTRAC